MMGWQLSPPQDWVPPSLAVTALGTLVPGRQCRWVSLGQMTKVSRVLSSPGFLASAPCRPAAVAVARAVGVDD